MIDTSNIEPECGYCFKDTKNTLYICSCGRVLCEYHLEFHSGISNCFSLCKIYFEGSENNRSVKIDSEYELGTIYEQLMRIFDNRCTEKTNFCIHSSNEEKQYTVKDQCGKCKIKKKVWVCLWCGEIGCGRIQYNAEGNGHSLEHFEKTGHSLVAYLPSVSKGIAGQVYCYRCDGFISNIPPIRFITRNTETSYFQLHSAYYTQHTGFKPEDTSCRYKDISKTNVSERGKVETIQKNVMLYEDTSSSSTTGKSIKNSNFRKKIDRNGLYGIVNRSQSCYVSSALQLLGRLLYKSNADLTIHFSLCELNPVKCFCCQLVKILTKLQEGFHQEENGYNGAEVSPLRIEKLLDIVGEKTDKYTGYLQEDCGEFLDFLVTSIKQYEDSGLLPSITPFFTFEVEKQFKCEKCSTKTTRKQKESFLHINLKKQVSDGVCEYFNEINKCRCGNDAKVVTIIEKDKYPEFLIIILKRYKITNGKIDKIKTPIGTRDVFLQNIIENMSTSDFGKMRYTIEGAVLHQGSTMDTGHYVWWMMTSLGSYLISDTEIESVSSKKGEEGVVFLYERTK